MTENPFVFRIQRYAIHDGPGIRTTLFFKGCPLSCVWCHNPESQAMPVLEGDIDLNGVAAALLTEIEKDLIFYEDSGGGATFSGGEPLCRPDLLFRLLDLCQEAGIHTCVDTCLYADPDLVLKTARKTDLMLCDIKLVNDNALRRFTGKGVSLVLSNLEALSKSHATVRMRFPLVPGITDTDENISGIITFLSDKTRFRDIHILPFHKAAEGKYRSLNMKNHYEKIELPSMESVDQVRSHFESSGFSVTIGG